MLDDIAARVKGSPGTIVTVALAGSAVSELVDRLDWILDTGGFTSPEVRLVLGRACRTLPGALAQLVVAGRLPYGASLGRDEFEECWQERSAGGRLCLVVADAQHLLADEPEHREDLLGMLRSGPHCLGGGWSTVVLADGTPEV